MANVVKHIENLVSSILKEAINERAERLIEDAKVEAKEKLHGGQSKIDVAEPKGKITKADFEKLRKTKKSETTEEVVEYSFGDTEDADDLSYNDMLPSKKDEKQIAKPHKVKNVGYNYEKKIAKEFNEEVSEGNAFTQARCEAICSGKDKFMVDGESFELTDSDMSDKNSCGCKTMKESKKTFVTLTEEEIIELIEKIVNEQTEVAETNASLKASGTENEDNIKAVTKKMQTYLKTGSKGKYEPNPKQFPKGNGELAKMAKKAYTPSKAVEEYIENFAYSPGMENIQYDEIKPNDEWLEKNIEGSSVTGNGEGGNAIDTGLGKKINAKRKANLYGKEKNKSYNRYPQPVDEAGETAGDESLDNIFSKLGESNEKKANLIKEEMDKMRHLLGYNQKTQ